MQRSDWLTIPNALTVVRMFGSVSLVPLAVAGREDIFVVLFLILAATDWLDGKLASVLNQRTDLGARLDSYGDFLLYGAALIGAWLLYQEVLLQLWPFIAVAITLFVVSLTFSYLKFRRWPSYHTVVAKLAWWLVVISIALLGSNWSVQISRIAAVAVIVANAEAVLLTCLFREPRVNVPSLWIVLARRRNSR